jgi:glutathione S-transferase
MRPCFNTLLPDISMLTLVIGNKNYSSWSLRPWIYLRQQGIAFEEVNVSLYQGDYKAQLARYTPVGKVPVLVDGTTTVWDSLAILEYLAERFSDKPGWPAAPAARALARSVSAEMHSGFQVLRQNLCMNVRKVLPWRPAGTPDAWPPEVLIEVARIEAAWAQCRTQRSGDGPFLFGQFSIADAMYAPVVWRLAGYSVPLGASARAYVDAMLALPAMREWHAAAVAETVTLPQFER